MACPMLLVLASRALSQSSAVGLELRLRFSGGGAADFLAGDGIGVGVLRISQSLPTLACGGCKQEGVQITFDATTCTESNLELRTFWIGSFLQFFV